MRHKHKFRIGDMVWCTHIEGEQVKGIVKGTLSGNRYKVKVILPKSRDERHRDFMLLEILNDYHMRPIVDED